MSDSNYYQQQPQQGMNAPPPQYNQNGNDLSANEKLNQNYHYDRPPQPLPGKDTFDETFKVEKPKYNDIPFAILFLATVAGFFVVAGITLRHYATSYSYEGSSIYNSTNSFSLNTNTVVLFAFVIVVALVLSLGTIAVARIFPRQFITISLILNVILGLGTAIAYLVKGYYSAGVVFLVFTAITAFSYWCMRSRIPFSATVMTIIIDVMKQHPSTWIITGIGFIVVGAFSALFSATVVASYMKWGDQTSGSSNHSKLVGLLVFVFFAGYYITEVLKNVIHVTVSGIYGTWYYLSKSDGGMPRFQALGALRRALTYSFGSICFGSLIVTLIQLLRQGVQIVRQNALNNGEAIQACLLLCVECFIYVIEWFVRYFNHYAYSYVALYGKSYLKSARDTHFIFSYKGMDALVNDCLIGTALTMYSTFVAYVGALLAYLYLRFTKPGYNTEGTYNAPVVAFTFLISMQICNVIGSVIRSGTSTFFLALAKDPEVYQASYPDRFNEVFRDYPQVLEKIRTRDD
ncbi:hypothetical protein OGAPHI_003971 [Ogataea philodendri]|uniref:Protein PNS1 n=1 Tax=Ogataea philodendri TaxID=1378263 RepID=A0A9P8P4S0_9ASCO|nr:uncharacterized protein OGAPHI_003971 [Ogataea philodendri]KAH3665783.1 hypothetical protein OGAPHI_003971 [Ogataea philodendri]